MSWGADIKRTHARSGFPAFTGASFYWACGLLVLMLALFGANYYVLVSMKQEVLAKEERQLRRLVDVTAASVDNVLNVTHIALESIRSAYQQHPSGQELHNILRITVNSIPYLRAAAVIDGSGRTHDSGVPPPAHELGRETCASDQQTFDPSVWNALVDMLGLERVQRFAEHLQSSLVDGCWANDASAGTKPLAAAAHACVSLSGQLGFATLSAASRNLETACLNGTGAESALDAFDLARLHTLIELERLLASPSRDSAARPDDRVMASQSVA